MNKIYHSRGFTLIEVMLALLILALGILGVSKLQGTLVKNSSDANQRAVAVALAQKKIDDLRSYAEMEMNGTSDWACPGSPLTAASLAYADIADDKGGAPGCDTGLLANTDILLGNTNYQLSWDVTPYLFVSNAASTMADASSAQPTVDFKNVEVTVSWLDISTGSNASVALTTIIDSYNPAVTNITGKSNAGGAPIYPSYTPEAAPDVIDVEVDTGEGTNRQTSKPLPDAVKTGADANTIVSFEVITYKQHPLFAGEFTATRQEEYITVDCSCTLSATNATTYPPAHVVWDDTEKDRFDYVGSPISKPTATQTNNANDADEVCTTCCRDHHDATASPVKYVPGTTSGNHTHYKADGTVASAGEEYIEACRLKLVDGVYRVFQDWKLYDITTMDREALASLAAAGGIQDTYSNYVGNYVLDQSGVSTSPTKPDAVTDVTTSVGAAKQLQARGIYLDKVYDIDGNENPSGYTSYLSASPVNADRLEKIPFTEVNLSLLANWLSDDDSLATVTDEPVATIADPDSDYYGTYSRGYMSALAETGATALPITASIARNNNGITQIVNPTNVDESDDINITIGPALGNFDITGSYSFSFPNGDNTVDSVSISSTGGGICNVTGSPGNTFSCNVAAPWTGTISITVKVNGSLKCGGTAQYSGSSITTDPVLTMTGTCS